MNLDADLQRQARMNVLDLILRTHPRRVWLYVKHRRWMLSKEYAMHQEIDIGTAPLYAAKTKALFRAGLEDEVIRGKYFVTYDINTLMRFSQPHY
jgi:hypothetical protein